MLPVPLLPLIILTPVLLVQQPLLCSLRRCIGSCVELLLLLLLLLALGVACALLLLDIFEMLLELLVPGQSHGHTRCMSASKAGPKTWSGGEEICCRAHRAACGDHLDVLVVGHQHMPAELK
jgi:hypothetical protein